MNPGTASSVKADGDDDPLSGDPELRRELAVMFLEDCPKLLSEIRAAIAGHDGPALEFAAHTLKGSVGVFKVQPAYEAALGMEHVGRDSDWTRAPAAWAVINDELTRLSGMLAGLTGSTPAP